MKTQTIATNKIKQNPNNPRSISDDKLAQLVDSIKEFPEMLRLRPIVVDETLTALGGNMRIKACLLAGITEVPIVYVDNLTDAQKSQFIIKDNVSFGEWDTDILADWDKAALIGWGLDVDFKPKTTARQDRVPKVDNINIVSKVGDIWQAGNHRIMCGDATKQKDVAALMGGKLADMVLTDPPYNVDIVGAAGKIKNDKMDDESFKKFLAATYKLMFASTKDGGVIYVAHSDTQRVNFTQQFLGAGFKFSQNLIWNKHSATLSRNDYNWKHECVLFGWKPGAAHYFSGDFTQNTVFNDDSADFSSMNKEQLVKLLTDIHQNFKTTVVNFDRPTTSELHPTMKPVGLVEKLVENSSKTGWLVLDLFAGAGSTIIACENSNRICYASEIEPKFVDVILRRWQNLTGKSAVCLNRKTNIK